MPTKLTLDPSPASSVRVTRNDPDAEGMASTPTSRNWRTSWLPDEPPRGTWPTPMTLALNAGPEGRVAALEGVAREGGPVWIVAPGIDMGGRGRRTATATTTANTNAPTSTEATTALNVPSLICPACLALSRPGSSSHLVLPRHPCPRQRRAGSECAPRVRRVPEPLAISSCQGRPAGRRDALVDRVSSVVLVTGSVEPGCISGLGTPFDGLDSTGAGSVRQTGPEPGSSHESWSVGPRRLQRVQAGVASGTVEAAAVDAVPALLARSTRRPATRSIDVNGAAEPRVHLTLQDG